MLLLRTLVILVIALSSSGADAQSSLSAGAAVDTNLSWGTYGATGRARVRVYAADDPRRPRTVVVDDAPTNVGLVVDEVRYFAETAGRSLRFDPAEATFVFRYTGASFTAGASDGARSLLLRATFRRSDSGELQPPAWRVITAEALEDLTSRQFRSGRSP